MGAAKPSLVFGSPADRLLRGCTIAMSATKAIPRRVDLNTEGRPPLRTRLTLSGPAVTVSPPHPRIEKAALSMDNAELKEEVQKLRKTVEVRGLDVQKSLKKIQKTASLSAFYLFLIFIIILVFGAYTVFF